MRIAINTIPLLSPLTGVGTYIYHIAHFLRFVDPVNEYTYFYGYYSRELHAYYNENKKILYYVKELASKFPLRGGIANTLGDFINAVLPRSFDLYFEPNFIPINLKASSTVITIFDFSFMLYPEWHPKRRIEYFNRNFWKHLRRADKIITISDYIKKEGIGFGLPEEKLRTIHLGIDKEIFKVYPTQELRLFKRQYGLPEHFILFVGSIEPRKNLRNLVRAYISLGTRIRKDIKLVLAGFKGWENEEVMGLLKEFKSDVLYLGYVSNAVLGKLYNLATLFVYPSFYEGFGLPPLEAMVCGCPVVVSNVTSLPEVCGDAAYYVDPYDIAGIAEGIQKVLTDSQLRESLIERGHERVKLFSWEKSAQEHIKLFEEVVSS